MNKIIMGFLIAIILIMGGTALYFKYKYDRIIMPSPEKVVVMSNELRGEGKLILAEQTVYQEYTKKYKETGSDAKILYRWLTTFQYLIDLQDPNFTIALSGETIKVTCPAIRLNDPAIDIKSLRPGIVLNSGLFIDESKVISEEMRNFKDESVKRGMELMKNPRVAQLCEEKVKLLVFKVASGMLVHAKNVEVTFQK